MKTNTTDALKLHRIASMLLTLGVGVAAYGWRRKVGRKAVLPALMSALAVATAAGTTAQELARRFLLNPDADPSSVDGRLAAGNDTSSTPHSGKEYHS